MLQRKQGSAAHILTFAQSLRGGGVERVMLRLAGEWAAAGRRVTLVIGDPAGPLADEIPANVSVQVIGSLLDPALAAALPARIRAAAPDAVFCPGNRYTSTIGWCRLRLGAASPPIVAKVSNALVRSDMGAAKAWAYRRWLRLHPRFIDALVTMSPAMGAEAVREMRMPRDRVHVIPNPAPRTAPAATATGVPRMPEGRYLLGLGRLENQKRWERAIAAMPRLADREVRLVILGEGGARAALEAQVAALGLEGRVLLPGYSSDPMPAIARAAAVVLTSDFEGVPGVIREALAAGTPAIATESSVAVRELIASPELGTVVPRGDADALVSAIDHWLAPGAVRPAPQVAAGDPAADYLALFDALAAQRIR